jgi:hypothetical protein
MLRSTPIGSDRIMLWSKEESASFFEKKEAKKLYSW